MMILTNYQIADMAVRAGVPESAITPPTSAQHLVLPRGRMNAFYRYVWKIQNALDVPEWTTHFDCDAYSILCFPLARAAMKRELEEHFPDVKVDGIALGWFYYTPELGNAARAHAINWYIEEPRSQRYEDLELRPWEPQDGYDLHLSLEHWQSCYHFFR
jgi:hypothetical protein